MFSSLNIKDLVAITVFSSLMIIVQLVSGAVTAPSYFVNMVLSNGLSCFVNAHIFLLMAVRIGKKGYFLGYIIIQSLVFLLLGYWFVSLYLMAVGLLIEFFIRPATTGQSLSRLTTLWTLYSFLTIGISLLPVLFTWEAFVRASEAGGFSPEFNDAYLKYYQSPAWVTFISVFTALAGFLGALSGQRLLRRYFSRSGLMINEIKDLHS